MNSDMDSLIQQIRDDKQALTLASQSYKQKVKAKLSSPWALVSALGAGLLLSRWILLKSTNKTTNSEVTAASSSINIPGLASTVLAAILPVLIREMFQRQTNKRTIMEDDKS